MRPIRTDLLLGLLDLESTGDAIRDIARSGNGLIVKRQREEGKAQQEFAATQLARFALPRSLEVPRGWGVFGGEYYVSEELTEGFCRSNAGHVERAVDYLAELHRVEVGSELQRELIDAGYAHYHGATLRSRLAQEFDHARESFGGDAALARELAGFSDLVSTALQRWDFEDDLVLGHGDFQRSNLRFRDEKLVPIDWTDFGVCDRAYDVMHFVYSMSPALRPEVLERYARLTGSAPQALRERGTAVDSIIRAGGRARQARLPGHVLELCVRDFAKYVAAGLEAVST